MNERSIRSRRHASAAWSNRYRLNLEALEDRRLLAIWTVNSTGDDGSQGTLRWAINSADDDADPSESIRFNIGSGAQTIPIHELPYIGRGNVTIDATTQPGYAGTPLITLSNAATGPVAFEPEPGLWILGGDQELIKGLCISGFPVGISIENSIGSTITQNAVVDNEVGISLNGDDVPNFPNENLAVGTTIGGTGLGAGNIISANSRIGVLLKGSATGNMVEGNMIGTTADGETADGNGIGVQIGLGAQQNIIGGTDPGAGNVISGNLLDGVLITDSSVNASEFRPTGENIVEGNKIGTKADGAAAMGNGADGVLINNGEGGNLIGGTDPGAGNLISGNGAAGVEISDVDGDQVVSNRIGTNVDANAALSNGIGVVIDPGSSNNNIDSNVISGNFAGGVQLVGTSGNTFMGNKIGTDGLGIFALGNGSQLIEGGGTGDGVLISQGSMFNFISGNLISGQHTDGVHITGSGTMKNRVYGNQIGTNFTGRVALPNASGVVIDDGASDNKIGDTGFPGNLISGNANDGIGIFGSGTTGNEVQANQIGTTLDGMAALGNETGVVIIGATSNTVGGTDDGSRNVISGNSGAGILITGSGTTQNLVLRNRIGTTGDGAGYLGNANGVVIDSGASDNTIGEKYGGYSNLISGNLNAGVEISGNGTVNNQVEGNLIGTNATLTASLGNFFGVLLDQGASDNSIGDPYSQQVPFGGNVISGNVEGVVIAEGAHDNTVGGVTAEAGNLISANGAKSAPRVATGHGIWIFGRGTTGNTVEGNLIGTDGLEMLAEPNWVGVTIELGASNNTVGGTVPGAGNLISGNATDGIELFGSGTTGNQVEGNKIGTDGSGAHVLGNSQNGVAIGSGASNNCIGGPGAGNVISGNLQDGIEIRDSGTSANIVEANIIGTDPSGQNSLPNIGDGVHIDSGASNDTIGGTATGAGNLIAGNERFGIAVDGAGTTNNLIQGNFIGSGPNGLANGAGVLIDLAASSNTVGGTVPGGGNVISGNNRDGIDIEGSGSSNNLVQGNIIGADSSGQQPLPNLGDGVRVDSGASSNTIAGNVISGNNQDGIDIQGSGSSDNLVQGDIIGADGSGAQPIPNGGDGVRIDSGANNNAIGGGAGNYITPPGNVIAFNHGAGVDVRDSASVGNSIRANSIFGNGSLGIDLGGDGSPTPNTPGGPHTGPNDLQNYPTLSAPLLSPSGTVDTNLTLQFTLNSIPATSNFTIEFFANATPDPSGNGQGQSFLGSMQVSTDQAGNHTDYFTYTPVPGEPFITATATDPAGNTSEFSGAVGPRHLHVLNGNLQIAVDNGQHFRLGRDPLLPQFLDLGFDKSSVSIDPAAFGQITVVGAPASEIDVEDLPAGTPLNIIGSGAETVNISPAARNLGHIQSPVSIKGDGSPLTLNIYDSGDPLADVYTLSGSEFSDLQSAGITFGGVTAVNLIGSSLTDTYDILNTPNSVSTAVYSNGGGDVINVEATTGPLTVNLPGLGNPTVNVSPETQQLDAMQGNLTVAGAGFGTLVLDDQAGTAARNYTLTANSLAWGSRALATFDKLGALSLNATAFNDTVTVQSLPPLPVNLDGGKGNNTLIGPDTDNTWSLARPSGAEGTLNNSMVFNSFASLIGGQARDRFIVPDGAYIPEFLSGGDGATGGSNNTLDLSAYTSPLTVHVGTYAYGGAVPGVVRAFTLCQNVIGGEGDDRFLFDQGFGLTTVDGGPGNNTLDFSPYYLVPPGWVFAVLGPNSGLVAGVIGSFTNVQNLIGTQTNDRFAFRGTAYLDGTINGGGGSNTLFYTQATSKVAVNLQTGAASDVNLQGGSTPQPGGISNIQNFVGSQTAPSSLIGPDATNTWTINGSNSGNLGAYTFSGFPYLTGGAAGDTFAFQQGGSVSGTVDGAGGINALDYSHYTGNIIVDLALNLASLVNQGAVGDVTRIANVTGSIGSDLLVGDANANVLIGGTGRNALIGGAGSDRLDASRSTSDNILIGGSTDFDTWLAALDAIFAEWIRTDLSFRDRYSDLTTGSNGTGTAPLNVLIGQPILLTAATSPDSSNGTVHADTSPDALIGSNQTDPATRRRAHNWFFNDADDVVTNFSTSSDHETRVR
jgi:parallel beta-helix repeat protein